MIYEKSKAHVFDPRQHRYKNTAEFMFVFSKGKPATFNPIMDVPVLNSGKVKKVRQRKPNGEIRSDRTVTLGDWQARGAVWVYEGGVNHSTCDKIAFQHPAIFPEALAQDHILSWSNMGDAVFDPFLGSGTTGKMAVLNSRRFVGFKLSEKYFDIATERIRAAELSQLLAFFN
jgi:site-specific DNA-methyltransferase (adenine-specific)